MKTYPNPSVLLFAALLTVPSIATLSARESTVAVSYQVSSVTSWDRQTIAPGATQEEVLNKMGPPADKISPSVWVYHGYHAENLAAANQQGCRTMLVTFASGRVSTLRFVNRRATQLIAASVSARPLADSVPAE